VLWPVLSSAGIIIGGETVYSVVTGDTLERIGARLGINWRTIVKSNNLDPEKPLQKGQKLKVNMTKIVPTILQNGIVINIPDRMLYFFKDGALADSFPVGLGKPPKKGCANWSTPKGPFAITGKQKNPAWYVPESIQKEMEEEGKPVKTFVPPGPDNPLGKYALKTSIPGVLIHETIWPGSVYQFRSHGCIRVMPGHMEKFFDEVEINTPGELIYVPVKVAISDQKRIFLEVHKDSYGNVKDLKAEAITLIENLGVSEKVNWQKVDIMLKEKSGTAKDITL